MAEYKQDKNEDEKEFLMENALCQICATRYILKVLKNAHNLNLQDRTIIIRGCVFYVDK